MTWKNETTRQRLPAPLPMYEPVRLKHVPTMVRRRYDRDLKTFKYPNEGLPLEEGKSDGDEVEDNDDPAILSDVGDSVNDNEAEDDYQANFDTEHDTESNVEDFGSGNIESSSSTYDGDSKIENDKDQDAIDTSSYVDSNVEDNTHEQSWQSNATSNTNDHGLFEEDGKSEVDSKDEDVIHDASDPNLNDSVVFEAKNNDEKANNFDTKHDTNKDTSVTLSNNGAQHNEPGVQVGFHEQDNNINDDGTIASWYENSSVQNKVEEDEYGNFDKEQAFSEEGDKSKGDRVEELVIHEADDCAQAKFDTKHDTNSYIATENSDTNEIQQRDDSSSVEARVEDSTMDHGHEDSDIKHQEEEEEEEEEDDGPNNDVNIDTSLNNGNLGDQHNEKGLNMEDCTKEDSGSMNAHVNESKDNEHGNFDVKQGLLLSDCKKIEDGTIANNIVDESFKLQEITIEKQHEDLDINQGIYRAQQSSSFAPTTWLTRRLIQVQWDPSPLNFHNLNFVNGLSTSSPKVGVIIRDAHGAILSAQVYKTGAISPVLAEAWALDNALIQANSKLGRTNLCNESVKGLLHIRRMISRDHHCPWNLQFLVEGSKHLH